MTLTFPTPININIVIFLIKVKDNITKGKKHPPAKNNHLPLSTLCLILIGIFDILMQVDDNKDYRIYPQAIHNLSLIWLNRRHKRDGRTYPVDEAGALRRLSVENESSGAG